MERYYRCAVDSSVGKNLAAYWRKALHAARRAEAYAKSMGAVAYIQPVQFFEGGVDFLEFDKEPDAEVWRKKVCGDAVVYEPRCNAKTGVMMSQGREASSSLRYPRPVWNKIFNNERYTWEQVAPKHPLEYWALITGYTLSGDKDADWDAINAQMRGKVFITFVEFSGDQRLKRGKVPSSLRKAIKAEKLRMSLPVVTVEELFSILSFQMPDKKKELRVLNRSLATPVFFTHGSHYYIKAQGVCAADGLVEICKAQFNLAKAIALKAAGEDEDW